MTGEQAKQKLIAWAQSQVGVREGANNYNKYAEDPDLKRLYGWDPQCQPWCDVWVDEGFIACFGLESASRMTYQPIGCGSALCRTSAQLYRDHGAFFRTPEPGDQAFFLVGGEINHTGLVVRVDGGSVICVEGNSSDTVAERVYAVGDPRIAGYGRPDWSVVATVDAETGDSAGIKPESAGFGSSVQDYGKDARYYELRLPYLRRGSTGGAVIAVQFQLAAQGYDIGPDGADGDFGRNTEAAVGAFQGEIGLTPDGVVGPETGARLFGGETAAAPAEPSAAPEAGTFWAQLLEKIRNGRT